MRPRTKNIIIFISVLLIFRAIEASASTRVIQGAPKPIPVTLETLDAKISRLEAILTKAAADGQARRDQITKLNTCHDTCLKKFPYNRTAWDSKISEEQAEELSNRGAQCHDDCDIEFEPKDQYRGAN